MEERSLRVPAAQEASIRKSNAPLDVEIDASVVEVARKLPANRELDVLSRREQEALGLFRELKELELEQEILRAEAENDGDSMEVDDDDDDEKTFKTAQNDLLEARSLYHVRQNVIDDILQADPILKAVHAGTNATPSERNLHPLIDQRDILAMCHNDLSTALRQALDALTTEEAENLRLMDENRTLAADLFQLAHQLKDNELDNVQDPDLLNKLQAAEADAKEARRQHRIIKGVVGGLIAGSGIDWAVNKQLRDLVLDAED